MYHPARIAGARKYGITAAGIIVAILILFCCTALADVTINQTNFPDKAFREYIAMIEKHDGNADGILSDGEIAGIASLICSDLGIESLKGIEYFPDLKYLDCKRNNLKALDLSKNTKLEGLYCSKNQLAKLDLQKNKRLEQIYCEDNQLTSLLIGEKPKLRDLVCYANKLVELDLTKCPEMKLAECYSNSLVSLKLPTDGKLEYLQCSNNDFDDLVLCGPQLKTLRCSCKRLFYLDVTECPYLNQLIHEQERGLDETYEPFGYWRDDSKGLILDVDPITTVGAENLVSEGNVHVTIRHLPLTSDYFPDQVFRTYLADHFDINHNGILSYREIYEIERLEINDLGIASLEGLQYFNRLKDLRCYNNKRIEFISKTPLPELCQLICFDNNIKEIDLSLYPKLTNFYASMNPLRSADFSNNPFIETVILDECELEDINLRSATKLKELTLSHNHLKTLDIKNSTGLERIDIGNNKIDSMDTHYFPNLKWLSVRFNPIQSVDFSHNPYLRGIDVTCCKLSEIDVTYCPELEQLFCYSNMIQALDLSCNPFLKKLSCDLNSLAELDLHNNLELDYISCSYNKIKELNLKNHKKLLSLSCSENRFETIEVSEESLVGECVKNGSRGVAYGGGADTIILEQFEINAPCIGLDTFVTAKAGEAVSEPDEKIILIKNGLIDLKKIFQLPESTKVIGEEAFSGIFTEYIWLPDTTEEIKSRAFSDKNWFFIRIPPSVHTIAEDAFAIDDDFLYVYVIGDYDSEAQKFAYDHNLMFIPQSYVYSGE